MTADVGQRLTEAGVFSKPVWLGHRQLQRLPPGKPPQWPTACGQRRSPRADIRIAPAASKRGFHNQTGEVLHLHAMAPPAFFARWGPRVSKGR